MESRLVESSNTESSLIPMLLILSENADLTDSGPYLIEHVLKNCCNTSPESSMLLTSLLTACCRLFLKRPAEYQHILGRVFELCMNASDANVHDKAAMYYTLLFTDIQLARSVILPVAGPSDTDQL